MIKNIPLNKKQMEHPIVSRWIKPVGFNIPIVTISEPLYGSALNLMCGNIEEARKYIKKRCDYDIDKAEFRGLFVFCHDKMFDGNRIYFMILPKNDFTSIDYGVLCHELHHFTHYALGNNGLDHSRESEEAFAYFQGYYMEHVVRALMEFKKIKK